MPLTAQNFPTNRRPLNISFQQFNLVDNFPNLLSTQYIVSKRNRVHNSYRQNVSGIRCPGISLSAPFRTNQTVSPSRPTPSGHNGDYTCIFENKNRLVFPTPTQIEFGKKVKKSYPTPCPTALFLSLAFQLVCCRFMFLSYAPAWYRTKVRTLFNVTLFLQKYVWSVVGMRMNMGLDPHARYIINGNCS